VGYGDVGKFTASQFEVPIDIHDPAKGFTVEDFSEYEYAIVCVDTLRGGPTDYTNLSSVLDKLMADGFTGIVIIRSTIGPDYVEDVLLTVYSPLRIVLFPEFYTASEMSSGVDKSVMTVLGGNIADVYKVETWLTLLGSPLNTSQYYKCTLQAAALIKLSSNAILATKVAMFNVIKLIADDYNVDYNEVRGVLGFDPRLGANYHSLVPSPDDGQYGFGGACLPKDTLALSKLDHSEFFASVLRVNKYLGR
jgi:UDPglucose 6-dehydrogenase